MLDRQSYLDAAVFARELERIWTASWLYAGPGCAAAAPGDHFTFELADYSLIVVRAEDGRLRALHNTCRHRGMPICAERRGSGRVFVCPYHQWTYGLDGRLLAAGGIERELEIESLGLRGAAIEEIGGLAFVHLGADPEPLGAARAELAAALEPQGFERARVAHEIEYAVAANWKLVWENNRECWHCHPGHPEYIRANFDAVPDSEHWRRLAAARAVEHDAALAASGLRVDHDTPGLYPFPTAGRWWSANRTPLVGGYVTESLDGQPVAPLMGSYASRDVGTLRVRTVPNAWLHASADHAVVTRLAPAGPELTRITVQWLVDGGAREGVDYDLGRLLPFWRLTSEQDWALCERNHVGVRNPAFSPGPRSHTRELNVIEFDRWYGRTMGPAMLGRS